tara:strand:- start:3357 stop:5453 length:2097 start_codon:yes stop_codon:yes gene_type:complete
MASQLKFNGNTYETHPLYGTKTIKKDVSFNYETTLDKVEFSNGDADLIINADYETEFVLWDGTTRYKFYKNDCVVRPLDRIVTVNVKVIGEYSDVKGKLDTQVNIADNKYIKRELTIPYAPILQFYLGGGRITSIINDIIFDTSFSGILSGVNDQGGNNGWYNARNSAIWGINTIIQVQSTDSEINGYYSPNNIGTFQANKWNNGVLQVPNRSIRWINDTGSGDANTYVLVDPATPNTWLYRTAATYNYPTNPMWDASTAFGDPIIMYDPNNTSDEILVYSIANPKFRIIVAKDSIDGWDVNELGDDDIVPNSAYTHALVHSNPQQYNLLYDLFGYNGEKTNQNWVFSSLFDSERGSFGKSSDQSILYPEEYFEKPYQNSDQFGIMIKYWKYDSIWFTLTQDARDILLLAKGKQTALFYDFEDVLSEMSGLNINSSFLNGLTPFKNNKKLYLSPLSNLKVRNYDEPATKQILTLSDMFLFLERVYNCYWDIYGGEIRVEHYSFFDDGSSYMGDRVVVDLVNETNSWNGKGIYGDEYAFIKEKSKKNKIWKFQNKHNELYEATVTTTSPYVEDGNDDKSVGKMNVDLITILLEDVSNDGVLVIEVDQNDDIIFEDKLINGGLAMTKAIPKYHLYGEGGSNTNYGAAKSRSRLKEETITHSIPLDDVHGLIRTREGNGKIDSVTIDNDGIVVIKLRHDKY